MITLALLAGGESSRMGRSKAALQVGGKPMLEYLLDRFAWPGPTMLVIAPGGELPPGADRFTQIAKDPVAGEGPLRGFLTALERSTTPTTIITAVDMPMIGHEQLQFIAEQLDSHPDAPGIALKWSNGGTIESMPCGVRTSANQAVQVLLKSGRRSIQRLIASAPFTIIEAPLTWPPNTWTNLNFPADFEDFRTIAPDQR